MDKIYDVIMNVLIPTDFSENSHNAIRYALDYFADIPVNFYILHVSKVTPVVAEIEQEGVFELAPEMQTIQSAAALLKEEIKSCQLFSKNTQHNFFSLHEDLNLVESIRKHLVEKEIDYILMGTQGLSKVNGNELGSNTCDVITKIKCPVLVVPENARFSSITNTAFVTDYNCIYRNKVISTLAETLDLHKSPLRVLHIKSQNTGLNSSQIDNKGFLHSFFKETKHSFHFVENKILERGIHEFVETWDIGLVAIVAKNLNFIQRLLLRPATENINYQLEVPFLVIHE